MFRWTSLRMAVVGLTLLAFLGSETLLKSALACPFCGSASLTLAEQMSTADAAVLVQWAEATKAVTDKPGSTTYVITQVVKGPATVKKGDRIKLDRYRAGKAGDLFLLLGTQGQVVEWNSPLEVTETSFNYIAQSPSPENPPSDRILYFMKFLEYSDPLIANDAFGEFANTQYKDIVVHAKKFPRDKLRAWLNSADTPVTRIGLYGMMLGHCGEESDAAFLKAKILEESKDFRLGIDGIMAGYLILKGEEGLPVIENHNLKNKDIQFAETFAAMQALRFMWTYGEGRISQDRLRRSMRLLLDRPELVDLVIADLARWKDWSVRGELMKMYGEGEYNVPSVKRAIVRYMLVCARQPVEAGDTPDYVVEAEKNLAALRKKDPKTAAEAERFFVLP